MATSFNFSSFFHINHIPGGALTCKKYYPRANKKKSHKRKKKKTRWVRDMVVEHGFPTPFIPAE
jgi:hypothetical protein